MLIPNISQLDELPFLKRQRHRWGVSEQQQQGQKSRIQLLQNLRCMTYQSSNVMAKLFLFEKQIKRIVGDVMQEQDDNQDNNNINSTNPNHNKQPKHIQQLIVTTQKQILSLQKLFYLMGDILQQQQFSPIVNEINVFVQQCKLYVRDQATSRFEVQFGNREFLGFAVYGERVQRREQKDKHLSQQQQSNKHNNRNNDNQSMRFIIKCSISSFATITPFKDITLPKYPIQPKQYIIINNIITNKLYQLYQQLLSLPLTITQKAINQYVNYFDTIQYMIDEQYLKLQVFKNYPLLRSKYYLPVFFNDHLTKQRLDGPIFSNSNPQCMFGHFYGYNADSIKILQGNNCDSCDCLFEGVQQNPVMMCLRDGVFNPYKVDVLYCPQYNRFKLIKRQKMIVDNSNKQQQQTRQPQKQLNQQQQPQSTTTTTTTITYLNYLHFRSNLRKLSTKHRNQSNSSIQYQKFPLTFYLHKRKMLIMDPARGRHCMHYQYTDLRVIYNNRCVDNNNNTVCYKCPICNNLMIDSDIVYLRQVQIIVKYLKYKCRKYKQSVFSSYCFVDHRQQKVFIEYKKQNKQLHTTETQIIQIKSFYKTLIDPYVSFNQYSLSIPDKYQKQLRNRYLFGNYNYDNQKQLLKNINNQQQKDSDQQYQYKVMSHNNNEDYSSQSEKLSKRMQRIYVQNQNQHQHQQQNDQQ